MTRALIAATLLLASALAFSQDDVPQEEEGQPSFELEEEVVDEEEIVPPKKAPKPKKTKKTRPTETFAGMGLVSPEIIPLEAMVRLKKTFMLRVYGSPGMAKFQLPFAVDEFEMRGSLFKVYSPRQQMIANITYGPHFGGEGFFFPGQKKFYIGGGMGIRQISATIDDTIDYYICTNADSSCGSGSSSTLRLKGTATSTSYLARAALGWMFQPTEASYINIIGLGISYPFSNSMTQNLNVELEKSGLPTWMNSGIAAAVNATLDPYEEEIAAGLYDAYGREYDRQPLPMAGITGGFRF